MTVRTEAGSLRHARRSCRPHVRRQRQSPYVHLLPLARHRRLQHRARRRRARWFDARHVCARGGVRCCCRRDARFHRASHRQIRRPRRLRGFPAPGTLATAIDDARRSTIAVLARRHQPPMGHARRQAHSRSSAPTTMAPSPRITDRSFFPFSPAGTSAKPTNSPISRPTGSTCRRSGPSTASPAALRGRRAVHAGRGLRRSGWSASAVASALRRANGAGLSPTGCSLPPASAATTTTNSRISRPGARPPRWCCERWNCGPMRA